MTTATNARRSQRTTLHLKTSDLGKNLEERPFYISFPRTNHSSVSLWCEPLIIFYYFSIKTRFAHRCRSDTYSVSLYCCYYLSMPMMSLLQAYRQDNISSMSQIRNSKQQHARRATTLQKSSRANYITYGFKNEKSKIEAFDNLPADVDYSSLNSGGLPRYHTGSVIFFRFVRFVRGMPSD